jgi:hypothetical protein
MLIHLIENVKNLNTTIVQFHLHIERNEWFKFLKKAQESNYNQCLFGLLKIVGVTKEIVNSIKTQYIRSFPLSDYNKNCIEEISVNRSLVKTCILYIIKIHL